MSFHWDRLQASFSRAQRDYESKMPPEDTRVDCPDCTDGKLDFSSCCEAEVVNGFCQKCHEHAEYAKCKTCDGTGLVEPQPEDRDYEPDPTDD